ncbi:MAG: uracil-DNA glycosylase [Woeseiaceae bacterium]
MGGDAAAFYDSDCVACPRLAQFLVGVREKYPSYHGLPVPPFGSIDARLLIVGLAPGMHGANATGRAFTGDHAGILLYDTLHKFGLANQPGSDTADDGLRLLGTRITNAVKCLPPQNKPIGVEVNNCNHFLANELALLPDGGVILALGGIAHKAIIRAFGLRQADYKFGHAAVHDLPDGLTLVNSYHCSRYNTQTRRLTTEMFETVIADAARRAGVGQLA